LIEVPVDYEGRERHDPDVTWRALVPIGSPVCGKAIAASAMQPAMTKLDLEDMIAVAARAAAREP
jgi:hypothetical protein